MERILALCHDDLDGIAASVAILQAHPEAHVTTRYVHYGNVNRELYQGLTAQRPYDRIVLADISFEAYDPLKVYPDVESKQLINQSLPHAIVAYTQAGGELVLIDHHPRALETRRVYEHYLHADSITELKDALGVARAGSELAGRYFVEVSTCESEDTISALLGLMELAGEYDTWRHPHGFGGKLAMAVGLMQDPHTVRQELELALLEKTVCPELSWEIIFQDTHLGAYAELAAQELNAVFETAWSERLTHSPVLTEIHVSDYPSLVAEQVYARTHGVVLVRYQADRLKANKLSLRKHAACPLDLNQLLKPLGGGGHAAAAGLKFEAGQLPQLVEQLKQAITVTV